MLHEHGMADAESLREMLNSSNQGGTPFCEAVVDANLVSDWDLSRVVAELFNLPFLPVDIAKPDEDLWAELASPTLIDNAVVPVRRFGHLLTVAMPGLVGADVLGMLSAETDYQLLPVVGTVMTNRRFIEDHKVEAEGEQKKEGGGDWSSLFDEGDAAVQASLEQPGAPLPDEEEGSLDFAEIEAGIEAELEFAEDEVAIEDSSLGDLEPPSLTDMVEPIKDEPQESGSLDLPPPPSFG